MRMRSSDYSRFSKSRCAFAPSLLVITTVFLLVSTPIALSANSHAFHAAVADIPTQRLRNAAALAPRPNSLHTSSASSDPPNEDEQLVLSFTQNFTALAYDVTAVAQADSNGDGYGPAYLVNGLTDMGCWYQVGLSWNWPYSSGNSYNPGFNMNYEVFNSNGNSIFPANGGGGLLSFSGPVNQGDTVLLSLYFTVAGQVWMVASDQSTGAQASEVYNAQGATEFVGASSNANGFFTGLMTEWYHNESYYGGEQQVVYRDYGSGISSAWMSIDEWDPQTNQTLFVDSTPSPVTYANPTLLQTFSSHNASEASDAYEFITGFSAPSVSIPLNPVALDVGQSQLFTPTVSGGTPPYSYQWYLNGLAVSGATGATWTFAPASAGFYFVYVNVTDSVDAIAISDPVTVTVDAAPTVSLAPAGLVALDGGQVQTFTANAYGGMGTLSYQWYLGGVAVPDATGSTYTFTAASDGSFVVDVSVTDSAPTPVTSAANPVFLTVNAAPTVSVAPVGPIALDVGQSELFTATAGSGSGTLYYQWYIGGSLVGTDSSIYTFVASSAGSIQVYVSVTDSASTPYTVKSNVASVTVNSVLSVAVSPSPVALDVGQVQTFTASASGGSGALHYQWCLDGNAVGSDNASYYYDATAGPHEVYVNVTDSASVPVTAESNIASVTVNPAVTVSIAPASWIMDVGQARLFNSSVSGGTSPYAYQWYLNDVAVSGATSATWTLTPGSFGSYGVYVNVTDNVGFRAISNIASVTVNPVLSVSIAPASTRLDVGDTQIFNLTVSGGTLLALSYAYQWYLNGTPISGTIGSTWNFTPTSPGSYTVYVKVTDSVGAQATSNTATAMASPQPLSPNSYLILVAVAAAAIVVGLAAYEILKRSVSARR